jgi:hypothetical protein
MITKTELLNYIDPDSNTTHQQCIITAKVLGYGHYNSLYRLPETLNDAQAQSIKWRMRDAGIKIPKHW